MKKISVIIALVIASLLLTGLELNRLNQAKQMNLASVLVTSCDLTAGKKIESEDLKVIEIPVESISETAYSAKEDLLGKTVTYNLSSNTQIIEEMITENAYLVPNEGNSMTTLKLNPEEAMCWTMSKGERVLVKYIDLEGHLSELGEVMVKGRYDQSLSENNYQTSVPVYLLVEGRFEIIDAIVSKLNMGRLEIVKKTEN